MKLENIIKHLDKETLLIILLKIIDEFPVIRYGLTKMIEKEYLIEITQSRKKRN